jgi:hypothetical protein
MIQDGPLDDLAASLVHPEATGIYLTKSEMIVLANLTEGSLRINERRRMLADVLKSPDSLEGLSALVDRIADLCQVHIDRYRELAETYPSLTESMAPWQRKAQATLDRLRGVQAELV